MAVREVGVIENIFYFDTMPIKIAIADDHQLFLKSLVVLINSFDDCSVIADAINGQLLLQKLELIRDIPDILLIDVNMPVMDGAATCQVVARKFPTTQMIALSMKDDDLTVLKMIRAGCCAYLLKEIHPEELIKALREVRSIGYYNGDQSNLRYRQLLRQEEQQISFSEKEKTFLRLASSDLTYKQIAQQMNLAERTIDGYREALFQKLNVQSRVGMVLEALRKKLIEIEGI